jgi:hypothetical protein
MCDATLYPQSRILESTIPENPASNHHSPSTNLSKASSLLRKLKEIDPATGIPTLNISHPQSALDHHFASGHVSFHPELKREFVIPSSSRTEITSLDNAFGQAHSSQGVDVDADDDILDPNHLRGPSKHRTPPPSEQQSNKQPIVRSSSSRTEPGAPRNPLTSLALENDSFSVAACQHRNAPAVKLDSSKTPDFRKSRSSNV